MEGNFFTMAEAQLENMRRHEMLETPSILNNNSKPRKKRKTEGKQRQKSANMTLHLTPQVMLSIWQDKDTVRLQIEEDGKKYNIPPPLWKTLHVHAESISLLLSFVEGQGKINYDYPQCYLYNSNIEKVDNPTVEKQQTPSDTNTLGTFSTVSK